MHTRHLFLSSAACGLLLASLLSTVTALHAAELEDVIAAYEAAFGGVEAYRKHTTLRTEGTVKLEFVPQMPPLEFVAIGKAPNLSHLKIDVPGHGVVTEGFDGTTAWREDPVEGITRPQGQELKQKRRDAQFYSYADLRERFAALAYEGRDEYDGRPCDVIKATYDDGGEERLFIDAETHMLRHVRGPAVSVDFGDYKTVDGIEVAHSIEIRTRDDAPMVTVKLHNLIHGVAVDDAIFAMPAEGGPQAGKAGNEHGKRIVDGSIGIFLWTEIGAFDRDGDRLIGEAELEKGYLDMLERQDTSCKILLQLFDTDQDGRITGAEREAVGRFAGSIGSISLYDRDGDWTLSDAETDEAWATLADQAQKHNERAGGKDRE